MSNKDYEYDQEGGDSLFNFLLNKLHYCNVSNMV